MKCVFISRVGWSPIVREGKIYNFEKKHYIFLMNTYIDLLDYGYIFKKFFNFCKFKLKVKILKMFLNLQDLYNREIGLTNILLLTDNYYSLFFKNSCLK